nr:winged helix-turn-helix domain-containing protein [Psychrobacillus lasiicapitis]
MQYEDSIVQLTLKEFYIIEALISRPKKTYTREELLDAAWEFDTYTDTRTVDSHIRNLREKLKTNGFPTNEFLKTVWGNKKDCKNAILFIFNALINNSLYNKLNNI